MTLYNDDDTKVYMCAPCTCEVVETSEMPRTMKEVVKLVIHMANIIKRDICSRCKMVCDLRAEFDENDASWIKPN